MSRSNVAKSRADKTVKNPSAPTPAVTHEIVPGKFNNNDWTMMLDHDDGDDFVYDLVEDICSGAMDVIFQNYIQKQLIPFTVTQAKDALLQIIEWQFLSRDEGETDPETDPGWLEDEEPPAAVTDCWAQGSVPRQTAQARTPSPVPEEEEEEETRPEEETEVENQIASPAEGDSEEAAREDSLPVEESSVTGEEQLAEAKEEPETKEKMVPEPPSKSKKKSKYQPHRGKLKSAGVSKMTESLEDYEKQLWMAEKGPSPVGPEDPDQLQMPASCNSLLRLQAGRPPGSREIQYDEHGNIINMAKIDPESLPSHNVRTKFMVVDPAVEAAQARLQAMRTGRFRGDLTKKKMKDLSPRSPRSYSKSIAAASVISKGSGAFGRQSVTSLTAEKSGISTLPPPLIEAMEVVPGVVVREGGRVKAGPRYVPKREDSLMSSSGKTLRPVALRATMPTISVAELLGQATPLVKPLSDSPPIPPIMPHPPSQPVGSR